MASAEMTMPQTRKSRARKSIAVMSSMMDTEDKENQGNGPASASKESLTAAVGSKRLRSKSLGPGGLNALNEEEDNARRQSAIVPLKSILKPTLPLSPLREIPARKVMNGSVSPSAKSAATKRGDRHESDTTTPGSPSKGKSSSIANASPAKSPRAQMLKIAEEEQRKKEKEEIKRKREERRKSMAGRRVSFAPEATLHTWDMIYDVQDQTASSASTDSTRRTTSPTSNSSVLDHLQGSSNAQEQNSENKLASARGRRLSGAAPMANAAASLADLDLYINATAEDGDIPTDEDEVDEDGDVLMGSPMSDDQISQHDPGSLSSTTHSLQGPSDAELDFALREAAQQAGTRQIELDEYGDISMEIAGDETTAAFKPWVMHSTGLASPHPGKQLSLGPVSPSPSSRSGDDMSMDMTSAVGRIIKSHERQHSNKVVPSRRQSMARRRRSSGGSSLGDMSMDMTTAVGGIQSRPLKEADDSMLEENEDLSMEFTTVFGGLRKKVNQAMTMPSTSDPNPLDDGTMDMTQAVGRIISTTSKSDSRLVESSSASTDEKSITAKQKAGNLEQASGPTSPRRGSRNRKQSMASSTGSPLVPEPLDELQDSRKAIETQEQHAPSLPSTPSKQSTPKPSKPTTPGKTPPSKNVAMRHPSPKKLFQPELRAAKSPTPRTPILFQTDSRSGLQTPSVILAPSSQVVRRTSGIGADKDNLGSPRTNEIFSRRQSINDQASSFAPREPGGRGVTFEDPKALTEEVEQENQEDRRRESGRFLLEEEADMHSDDKDTTTNLKEMIQSMTPRKAATRSRKSLAVGSAKGVLGKRPAELDDSDDDEHTAKSLKGREASPVKKIRLDQHSQPIVALSQSNTKADSALRAIDGNARPKTPDDQPKGATKTASTPRSQGRFKNISATSEVFVDPMRSFGDEAGPKVVDDTYQKVPLQDFLNLTGIRFMDLTTTKRRATTAPSRDIGATTEGDGISDPTKHFEDSVVAGACTIPMLDMYSHSCRELKKYIAEGRAMVKDFEAEVLEENPPLFREYLLAAPTERGVMDSQFKNVKTHARLSSKGTWYEWRRKLLQGIMTELTSTSAALKEDESYLTQQTEAVESELRKLVDQRMLLIDERDSLQLKAGELSASKPAERQAATAELQSCDDNLAEKTRILVELEDRMRTTEESIEEAERAKADCQSVIKEAQRLHDARRGWSVGEILEARAKVEALEAEHGWRIKSASGTALEMVYKDQLQLFIDVAEFLPAAASQTAKQSKINSVLSLTYAQAGSQEHPLTNEKRFFLQMLRAHVQGLSRQDTEISQLLHFVGSSWSTAITVADEVRRLDMVAPTQVSIVGDERMRIRSSVLLPSVDTKLVVEFGVTVATEPMEMEMQIRAEARICYGEKYREDKMSEFLNGRIDGSDIEGEGTWVGSVLALKQKLVAQGRKGRD